MQKELIDMLERVLQEAITQDPFQGDDYDLLHEAEALLAKAKAAQQSVQRTCVNSSDGEHHYFSNGNQNPNCLYCGTSR